jgi:hypothetical protein
MAGYAGGMSAAIPITIATGGIPRTEMMSTRPARFELATSASGGQRSIH